jgi:hypothetical protein
VGQSIPTGKNISVHGPQVRLVLERLHAQADRQKPMFIKIGMQIEYSVRL